MLIEALGLPQHCAEVLALIVACASSYAHESELTSSIYTVCAWDMHAVLSTRKIQRCVSSVMR